eukprot:656905-Prymnesium_polylepis.1
MTPKRTHTPHSTQPRGRSGRKRKAAEGSSRSKQVQPRRQRRHAKGRRRPRFDWARDSLRLGRVTRFDWGA